MFYVEEGLAIEFVALYFASKQLKLGPSQRVYGLRVDLIAPWP